MDSLDGSLTDSCSRVQLSGTAQAPQLRIVSPDMLARNRIALASDVIVGRKPLHEPGGLPHPRVSRRHAAIRQEGEDWLLEDLGSRNGTRVNGIRINLPHRLQEQDVVRFGDVIAVYDVDCTEDDNDVVIPGVSRWVGAARRQLRLASRTRAHLLIYGETGCGKEYIAREAHRLSQRRGEFVEVNCGALPPQLVSSLLFGHKRGAFTSASASEAGLFRAADGGTLFLDEVGELPLEVQPMFLRVLQDNLVRPVGETKTYPVDVRIVAATNRDLAQRVEQGAFRRDLYARLSAWFIRVPPLRERRVDVMQWLHILASNVSQRNPDEKRAALLPHADLAEWLLLQPWEDNLRGLNRVVERLSALRTDTTVQLSALRQLMPEAFEQQPLEPRDSSLVQPSQPAPGSRAATATAAPRPPVPTEEQFRELWSEHAGNIRRIAIVLQRDRKQIRSWAVRYGLYS